MLDDRKKDKIGFELNFTQYFYKYQPPSVEEIERISGGYSGDSGAY